MSPQAESKVVIPEALEAPIRASAESHFPDPEDAYERHCAIAMAREAVALAIQFQQEQGWQPIETAPKDGTPIWLVEDGGPLGLLIPHQFVGYWRDDTRYVAGGFWQVLTNEHGSNPTHWMLLPNPPSAAAIRTEGA